MRTWLVHASAVARLARSGTLHRSLVALQPWTLWFNTTVLVHTHLHAAQVPAVGNRRYIAALAATAAPRY